MKKYYKKISFPLFLVSIFFVGNISFTFAYNFSQTLTVGSSGNDVVELQKILVNAGHLIMPSGISMGTFGNLTKLAVIKYQSANNISQTGTVGPITRASLKNIDSSEQNTSSSSISSDSSIIMPIINKTDSGAPVITVNVSSNTVASGTSATIDWKSDNAVDQCKITSKDSAGKTMIGTIDLSGSKSTGPIVKSTIYTIVCYNKYGIPGSKSVTVNIIDPSKITSLQKSNQAASISSLSTSTGNRGDIITIKGTNFLSSNDIYFDGLKIDSSLVIFQSSTSIIFKIPEFISCLSASCIPPTVDTKVETGGKKIIQIANTNGFSNDISFTLPNKIITIAGVPSVKSYVAPKMALNSIIPTSGNRGDVVVLMGTSFSSDTIVFFGGFKVADYLIISKTNNLISFFIPPFQMGCTEPEYEVCPKLPLPGNGLVIETGGIKNIYTMNSLTKATSTAFQFTLPSKKITY